MKAIKAGLFAIGVVTAFSLWANLIWYVDNNFSNGWTILVVVGPCIGGVSFAAFYCYLRDEEKKAKAEEANKGSESLGG